VLRAVILTQYRRVTDGRTDGRKCHSYYSACNASIAARCKNPRWLMTVILKTVKLPYFENDNLSTDPQEIRRDDTH